MRDRLAKVCCCAAMCDLLARALWCCATMRYLLARALWFCATMRDLLARALWCCAAMRDLFNGMESAGQSVPPIAMLHILHMCFPRFAEKGEQGGFQQQVWPGGRRVF